MPLDLRFTEEETAFRQDVRDFIDANLPAATRAWMDAGHHPTPGMMREWMGILAPRGWSTPAWPKAHGGPGWTPQQIFLFNEALQSTPAPTPLPFNVSMVGPVIYTFGNDDQKARFLPRIARCEDWWCQGFSEPEAGSDLASLRTTARREGDHYVINGQKTWTSYAQYADWIFVLARTDPAAPKQAGISFLLVDMKTPGITVRPIVTIDGGREVNEVFFDNVKTPVDLLVGEENKGWTYAKFLLGQERMSIARVGTSRHRIRRLKQAAAREADDGARVIDDPLFRAKVAALEVELRALEITQLRAVAGAAKAAASGRPDPITSILKIKGSEIQQATTELLMDAAGPYALPYRPEETGGNAPFVGPEWAALSAPTYFNWRKVSIYGGSNEIQKTIIAKAFLGL